MLFRKVLRDLRINAIQFLAIYIMTALALLVVSGFDSSDTGAYNSAARYLTETNYKDISVSGGDFTQYDIALLDSLDEVANVNGVRHATGKVTLDRERPLAISYIDGNDVSRMLVIEGEEYTPGADGVWIEALFAEPMGIEVGDTLVISTENTTLYETVRGIVYSSMYIYYVPNENYVEPEYGTHGFAIMDIGEAPGEELTFDELMVDLTGVKGQGLWLTDEEKKLMNDMRSVISARFDDPKLLVKTKTEDDLYDEYVGEMSSGNAISTLFPIIFVLVAMLGIITTMTRLTGNQRTQIGTLKALGFSRRTITLHYLSYTFFITVLGGVTGVVLGVFTLGQYLNDLSDYFYQNPYMYLQLTGKTAGIFIFSILLSVIVTYLCTRKLLAQNASDILRPEAPRTVGAGMLEKTPLWERLKFAVRWNIRDVSINKFRTLVSIMGIVVCSQLLFTAVGFFESLHSQAGWMYDDQIIATNRMVFDPATARTTVVDYAKEYSGQMIQSSEATIFTDTLESVRTMTVIDEGNLYLLQDEELNYMELPKSGVVLTSKMVDYLEIGVGDIISWRIAGDDRYYSAPVVAVCKQPNDQGIVLSRQALEECGGEFNPNMIYSRVTIPSALRQQPEVMSVETVEKLKEAVETSNEIGYSITTILVLMAVSMGVVVLYNLGELSYIEKVREIATLKVLGFQSGFIRLILLQQNLTVTILGAVIGVPLGYGTLMLLVDLYMDEGADVLVSPGIAAYLVSVLGTFAVSVLVNLFVTSKVNRIDMVEALKGVE